MTTSAIREKLVSYLQVADEKKIRAIYTMVEDDINTAENDWPEEFIDELNSRSQGTEEGTASTYSWEDMKTAGIEALKQAGK